ncbi:MAG: NADH dehydrogenase FAD-containing subunit [Deltaproteobacteria bacterium]|nr:NADH dehydrogenase FAD-containing subunit [Deltaproteobacteria bacterium]
MIAISLVSIPVFLGFGILFFRKEEQRRLRRRILLGGAVFHLVGTAALHLSEPQALGELFITVDSLGLLFLSITSLLFFLVALYAQGYFHHEHEVPREGVSHLFVPCMFFFLAAMTLVTVTSHIGLLWVAIEATTLASAPLIYYHRHHQALEAAWKYLLICSVGIALAFLGIFFTAVAAKGTGIHLFVSSLSAQAGSMDPRWLRIGFLLVLVGFGTKVGLAPLHNWLPDAHSEAPSPVSALLSGALLNCAFLGILRFYQILIAAGLAEFAQKLLILLGLISLFVAALFISGQRDYKRMLAYSSIEHMGILALAVGIGADFAGLLHAVNHSLTKALLFLVAGQILILYRTKIASDVHGLLKTIPPTGFLWVFGGLAIIGTPPFSLFVSEFLILKAGLARGHFVAMGLYLLFLGIIFVSFSRILFAMVQGDRRELPVKTVPWSMLFSPAFLAAFVLLFGLYLPQPVVVILREAARLIRGVS